MTTTTSITNAQKITVLKHLAGGRDTRFAATVTHLPQADVDAIADEYGWPDLDKVRWAIDELTAAGSVIPSRVDRTPAPAPEPRPTPAARHNLSVARRPAPTATPTPEPVRTVTPSANELIVAASRSTRKRTQALGVKVAGLLGDLAKALREEEEAETAAREAAEAKVRNAKRIAELEAELAKLKGKTTTAAKPAATTDGPTSKEIRTWAAQNGVTCPPVGRVPATVRQAYDNAHAGNAA